MIYRAKGDRLYTYVLCQKGYTYKIFMWNDPLPKTYLAKKILPLHARVMAFFDTVEEKHHQCAMDHLYNSDAFFKGAYNHGGNY